MYKFDYDILKSNVLSWIPWFLLFTLVYSVVFITRYIIKKNQMKKLGIPIKLSYINIVSWILISTVFWGSTIFNSNNMDYWRTNRSIEQFLLIRNLTYGASIVVFIIAIIKLILDMKFRREAAKTKIIGKVLATVALLCSVLLIGSTSIVESSAVQNNSKNTIASNSTNLDITVGMHEPFEMVCSDGYSYEIKINSISVKELYFGTPPRNYKHGDARKGLLDTIDILECIQLNVSIRNTSKKDADLWIHFVSYDPRGVKSEYISETNLTPGSPGAEKGSFISLDSTTILMPQGTITGNILLCEYSGSGVYTIRPEHALSDTVTTAKIALAIE